MVNKKINNNGFDYVDLGLRSGTLWATCNVGATKPTEYGLYFQWGDTVGYAYDQIGKEKQFGWSDYNCRWKDIFKHATNNTILKLEFDAAHINMGGSWHMPTFKQIKELTTNTISNWTTQDGVNGRLFTSKKDDSKSIFIPAAGGTWGGSVLDSGNNGFVWSSMLNMDDADYGQDFRFNSYDARLSSHLRFVGFSVRGVI